MYEADTASVYHDFYRERKGKDYAAEAAHLAALVRERMPQASSLLDVACGSGSHLEHFVHEFEHVEGIELSEAMLSVARPLLPGVRLHQGDMRDFSLDRRFSAVTCMYSSIGYTAHEAGLRQTIACLARHLEPGGVLLVEAWWTPGELLDRYVAGDTVKVGDRTISRVSHTVDLGDRSRMEVHWVVADPEHGIRHVAEQHELALFEQAQYEAAFELAGLTVEHIRPAWSGPGLFVGVLR
ncbi:class I SAM-dependent methyltransferase [Lentzea tibetensis]|uniref:Class I SAM-dependent methyltransferase n=1 Tax=Lentzea tibetensis TaxID=2591470 RepID=A0A563ESM9_9PSEU|nr:class I SAM-dependent methyltransferase [Lentzea tibetensis]TWP50521.1 class I SAM-dependent methyltransferase [Lentzea tibetensis]